MRLAELQAIALALTLATPALADQSAPHITRLSAPNDQRVTAMQRQIGALRQQIGRIELQRLIDRVTTEPAPAAAAQFARIGPR